MYIFVTRILSFCKVIRNNQLITPFKELHQLNRFSFYKIARKTTFLVCLFISLIGKGQLVVNGNITNTDIITNLFGPGVVISNLVVNCGPAGANQYGSFTAAGTGLGINSGLLMTNGTIQGAIGPNDTNNISSTCVGTSSSDACITGIASGQQHDPCIITFDITPSCDTLTMNYVFGSEEYPDFVNSFNDAFGFFINGPKPGGGNYSCTDVAIIPGTTTPVSINTVNDGTNSTYFRVNTVPSAPTYQYIKYNGLTTPLQAIIPVIPCQKYTMELAIVDLGDCNYDSGVFLQYEGMKCANDQTLTVTPKDTSICIAGPITLTASGMGNYTWSPASGLNTTAGAVVIATPTAATTQYVVSSSSTCITETDTVTIKIGNPKGLTVKTTSANTGCGACIGSASVTSSTGGSGGPYSYTWLPGNMTTQAVTSLCAGTYTVIVHDNGTNCPAPDDSTIIVINQVSNPKLIVQTSTAAGCTACTGTAATTVSGGSGGPYTYQWLPGGMTSQNVSGLCVGNYSVIVTDAGTSCVAPNDTSVVVIVIPTPPNLSVKTSVNNNVCKPCSSSANVLSTTGGTGGPYTYQWLPGKVTTQAINGLCTGTYSVVVHDNGVGCTAPNDTSVITVLPNDAFNMRFTADSLSGCYPICVTFNNGSLVNPGTIKSVLWDFGDGDTSSSNKPDHCFTNPGAFTIKLTVTSSDGCSADTIIPKMINAYSYPVAAFVPYPQATTILDPVVQYTDQSTDKYGIISWLWTFSNPTTPFSINTNPPPITYTDTGTFCSTLRVINKYGCADSVTGCVDIQPLYAFYIPNAFTPNHDGLNDIFLPQGSGICGFDMYIYDRWGSPVYHTSDINKGWNGTAGSSRVEQEDTYVYLIITVDCAHHTSHRYVGSVSLIR